MTFRHAKSDEAEAILQFWVRSGASLGTTDHVGDLRRAIEHPAAVLVLALDDDAIIGTVLGTFDGWRGNIYRLVVAPDRRRQGIGRALVRQIEQVFAEWGVRRTTVLVEVDRPWAAAFWTAVGYPRDLQVVRHVAITAPRMSEP